MTVHHILAVLHDHALAGHYRPSLRYRHTPQNACHVYDIPRSTLSPFIHFVFFYHPPVYHL